MAEKQFRNSRARTGRTLEIKDRHEPLKTALMRQVALRTGDAEHGHEAARRRFPADYLHQ
ncbi:hypothetical protein OO006_08815 [Prosthecochloris sp. SCSIO W1101]|uniref:hypothetical protein n=1 Tax=Prosthecochloris sp. SCSIO W1101 TaxID=2992242 RepID=UPI00223DD412|nr:hypothetical protein [Prosthecochloris sp. SCSIO W1101]UZJ40461.1 hypothetical protein OO006_08815 [Prosthecochloris sp. SCSIO W1101]